MQNKQLPTNTNNKDPAYKWGLVAGGFFGMGVANRTFDLQKQPVRLLAATAAFTSIGAVAGGLLFFAGKVATNAIFGNGDNRNIPPKKSP